MYCTEGAKDRLDEVSGSEAVSVVRMAVRGDIVHADLSVETMCAVPHDTDNDVAILFVNSYGLVYVLTGGRTDEEMAVDRGETETTYHDIESPYVGSLFDTYEPRLGLTERVL